MRLQVLTGRVEHDQSVFLLLERLPEILGAEVADAGRLLLPGLLRRRRGLGAADKTSE